MKITISDHVTFQPDKMAKVALAATPRAQLDLYCLAPGQAQKPHTHPDQDKIYWVIEGEARVRVGDAEETVRVGEAVVASAGAPHGITNATDAPLLVLVVVTPPPRV